jgi:phosphate transport system permease protein
VLALAGAIVAILFWQSWLSITTNGISFFTTSVWDPEPDHRRFGALAFVYGTVVTSIISMIVAVPLGVGTAAFLSEIAPTWLRRAGSFFVEMLAAIPSVVYGFWGLYVFAPFMQRLISNLGGPDQAGIGLLPAGIILGIMIVPYASAVSFDVIRSVPRSQREGAAALGATRWQTIRSVVLPFARGGIIGGCFLSLGRALGETMAVTMLIGNRPDLPDFTQSLAQLIFAKGDSIPSVIANQFTEATYDLYLSALVQLGLVLLMVSVGFSALGRVLIKQMNRRARRGLKSALLALMHHGPKRGTPSSASLSGIQMRDAQLICSPTATRTANWISRIMTGGGPTAIKIGLLALIVLAAVFVLTAAYMPDPGVRTPILVSLSVAAGITVLATMGILGLCQTVTTVPLFLIVGYLLYMGATSLSWDFFTQLPAPVGETGGGMVNAFYGSALMIGLATAFSVPVGLLAAIYLAEYRSEKLGSVVRFVAEMLGSVPSIVIGIFGYYAIVKPITQNFSGLAGGFALGIMMLPIVIRASEEALKIVPKSLRHGSLALGAAQWQTIVRVTVPAALPAIITAVFLSIARVAGETAPLLLTASSNSYWPRSINDYTPSLPVFIFNYAVSPYDEWHRQAWAAAFVLVAGIMVLNVGIRLLSGKRVLLASHAD